MNVFIVLYEDHEKKEVDVLDVYTNEERANRRVGYERDLIPEADPHDNCWYQEREVITEAGE
ncbi:hypothetical protein [Alkalibacillus almallahensis]|uniref:hypothetical protein n=1 Tax=Alkalibacillus almallahensis TaxID=1379154 RepID=UPI0014219E38|nr:hypothetical protein [Alkalibacillus almallahensis]NIK10896.1 hypothetical protein [Alkalibacillus almallahensis]